MLLMVLDLLLINRMRGLPSLIKGMVFKAPSQRSPIDSNLFPRISLEELVVVNNIRDFINNYDHWKFWLKNSIKSLFLRREEKEKIILESTKIAEEYLRQKHLFCPFVVSLDDSRDEYLRTCATYESHSFENGLIVIKLKSTAITRDRDLIVMNILHEYSHAIVEASEKDAQLVHLILNLKPHIKRYPLPEQVLPDSIPGFSDLQEYVEKFCEWFAYYIADRIGNISSDEIFLCQQIIGRFQIVYRYMKTK